MTDTTPLRCDKTGRWREWYEKMIPVAGQH
jgi:hypothetical protein